MITQPIIPIPYMVIISIILLIFVRRGIWNYIRQIIIVVLLFLINLRIMIPTDNVTLLDSKVDILFVVDNTISMLAEDYNGDDRRIDAVKADIATIIEEYPGARFSLISFADQAVCLVPYTYEEDLIIRSVNALNGRSKEVATGTNIDISYDTIIETLKRNQKYSDEGDRLQIIFFISDGENTDGYSARSFDKVSDYIDGGAVLGYGTKDGGVMYVRDYYDSDSPTLLTYYDDYYHEEVAVSHIDEKNLKNIAEDMEVPYYHMTKPSKTDDVIEEVQNITNNNEIEKAKMTKDGYAEIYWMFAIALAGFLFIDFVYYRFRLGRE